MVNVDWIKPAGEGNKRRDNLFQVHLLESRKEWVGAKTIVVLENIFGEYELVTNDNRHDSPGGRQVL
jgi:hypothetical protein